MGRTWSEWASHLVCLLHSGLWESVIRPIESNRCRILMDPQRRPGIDAEGFEGHGAKHLVQVGSKQRIEDLASAVIVEGFPP